MLNKYFRIEAFSFKNGEYQLQEFATGIAHKQAGDYFRRLHDTNEFAKITMKPTEEAL
tara:strand:- start:18 stop:191 length:174 start_codon:yes stop_codon:yes gene_type:complete